MVLSEKSHKPISIVIPFLNEEETVVDLHARLLKVSTALNIPFEIIFIDDGSADSTFERMRKLSPLVAVRLHKNSGQTAALAAGISQATSDVVVTLDGDLENDPDDIPKLLEKLNEGFDVVCGWRKDRWRKNMLTRRWPSELANKLISAVSGLHLHDHGCPMRAYRKEILDKMSYTGDMHRMFGAHAAREGARVTEVPIGFAPRQFGVSKYGMSRIFKVLLDVIVLHFYSKYARRPMHFFGAAGFFSFTVGAVSFLLMLWFKYFGNKTFIQTPLPVITALFIILGFQFILMGVLAEMMVRMNARQLRENDIKQVVRNI